MCVVCFLSTSPSPSHHASPTILHPLSTHNAVDCMGLGLTHVARGSQKGRTTNNITDQSAADRCHFCI